jgi:hypothetical protein
MSLDEASTTGSSGPAAFPATPDRTKLEYFRAYQAVLMSGNWPLNIFWGTLAFFSSSVVPLVGGMVWTGYLYECVEQLHHTRGTEMPDFDVNRFGDYLTRGVFPFLVQLVIWIALGVCYFLLYPFMFAAALTIEGVGEEHALIVLATGGVLYLFTVAAVILTPIILLAPLMLRLGLSQDLSVGFRLSWWGDFLRRMWLELVLSTMFVLTTGLIMTTLGCLLIIVGSYAAWAWVSLASAHLSWQLYDLYLARGGEPVPLKPRRLVPPPYSPPGIQFLSPPTTTM